MLHYYPIPSTACPKDGTSDVICRRFLLCLFHIRNACWEDSTPPDKFALPATRLITADGNARRIRERAKARVFSRM